MKLMDREYYRIWDRAHRVTTTNHRKLSGNKRPYPESGACEQCRKVSKLDYHHWDDSEEWG